MCPCILYSCSLYDSCRIDTQIKSQNGPRRDSKKKNSTCWILFGFLAVFVPIMLFTVGLWGLFKFWLLPLIVMHLNVGSIDGLHGLCKPTCLVLLPELAAVMRPLEKSRAKHTKPVCPNVLEHLGRVPLYRLSNALKELSDSFPSQTRTVTPKMGLSSYIWSFSGVPKICRDMLMWSRRDIVLHGAILVLAFVLFSGVAQVCELHSRYFSNTHVLSRSTPQHFPCFTIRDC